MFAEKPMRKAFIEVEKIDNGYIIHFTDETNWKVSKTVHETWENAESQFVAHVVRMREMFHAKQDQLNVR